MGGAEILICSILDIVETVVILLCVERCLHGVECFHVDMSTSDQWSLEGTK